MPDTPIFQEGDRVRIRDFYCGVLAKCQVGTIATVVEIGYNGGVSLKRDDWADWQGLQKVPADVAATHLERLK